MQLKRQDQDIITLEFLFPFSWLNLDSLSQDKQEEVVETVELKETEAVKVFEYRKNNERY